MPYPYKRLFPYLENSSRGRPEYSPLMVLTVERHSRAQGIESTTTDAVSSSIRSTLGLGYLGAWNAALRPGSGIYPLLRFKGDGIKYNTGFAEPETPVIP